jgi:NNP family nitrate/nitrite transporter-like MFS transporter
VVPLAAGGALFGALAGGPQALVDPPGAAVWLQNAGLGWVPAILVVAWLAWRYMDDLEAVRASLGEQTTVVLRRDTWILAWLYLGTFGSYIGFAAGFPLVADVQFGAFGVTAYAFAGPLVGALARPVGGWLADRHGGAQVAIACFAAMAGAIALLLGATASYGAFLAAFALLFVASGVGNGAVFQMFPRAFARFHVGATGDGARAAALEAAAALGVASGIAAFGAFFIPKAYGTAVATIGDTRPALALFLLFYLSCIAVAWWFYARPGAATRVA